MQNIIYKHFLFKLGEEAYDREFEIIPIPPYEIFYNNLSLEPYEYFGEISEILGRKASQIFLYYNADVLMKVEIVYNGNVTTELVQTLESLQVPLPSNMKLNIKYYWNGDVTVLVYYNKLLDKKSQI